jgi:hypothetical protein
MFIFMYVYRCVYINMYTNIYMYIYIYVHEFVYTHIYIYLYLYEYTHIHAKDLSICLYQYLIFFARVQCLGYFTVGLFCYICSFLLLVWLFFFIYALLAVVYVSHEEDRFFNTPRL